MQPLGCVLSFHGQLHCSMLVWAFHVRLSLGRARCTRTPALGHAVAGLTAGANLPSFHRLTFYSLATPSAGCWFWLSLCGSSSGVPLTQTPDKIQEELGAFVRLYRASRAGASLKLKPAGRREVWWCIYLWGLGARHRLGSLRQSPPWLWVLVLTLRVR